MSMSVATLSAPQLRQRLNLMLVLGASLAQPGTLFQAHLDSGRMESLFVGAMEPDPAERLVALRFEDPHRR